MSQSEDQWSCRPPSTGEVELEEQEEKVKRIEEDTPLVAMAPDASFPEERPSTTDIYDFSPAFQCLNELLSSGKLSMTKGEKLKASYKQMQDVLKRSELNVQQLERNCAELRREQAAKESGEKQASLEVAKKVVSVLKQQLQQASSKLRTVSDIKSEAERQVERLQKEKKQLESRRELAMQPKPEELGIRALKDKHEELKTEVAQTHLTVRGLQEELETCEMQVLEGQKALEDNKKIIESKQVELVQLARVHGQLLRGNKELSHQKVDKMKELEALNEVVSERSLQLKEAEEHISALKVEHKEAMKKQGRLRGQMVSDMTHRQLLKETEAQQEAMNTLMGDRGLLEMKLENIMTDRELLSESKSRQLRELKRVTQALERMEGAQKLANEKREQMQLTHNKMKDQIDACSSEAMALLQREMELQKEKEALKASMQKKCFITEVENQKSQYDSTMLELQKETSQLKDEVHNLKSLTQVRAAEKLSMENEQRRLQKMLQLIQHEQLQKDLDIKQYNTHSAVLKTRLSKWTKACDRMITKRDEYSNLSQLASEQASESTCELQVLKNEYEILCQTAIDKERSLAEGYEKLRCSHIIGDRLHEDISEVKRELLQLREQDKDYEMRLSKLKTTINAQEKTQLELTERCKADDQSRNDLHNQLLERGDEMCRLNEKVTILENSIAKHSMEVDKDKGQLQLAVMEEERQIDLKRKEQIAIKEVEGQIATLQTELLNARGQNQELENAFEGKIWEIQGLEPSNVELLDKIEQLEIKVAQCERQVLEQYHRLDQMNRLIQPIQEENDKWERLEQAKKLNKLQSDINKNDCHIKAALAQINILKADNLSLEKDIEEKKQQVELHKERLQQGLPPCPEMEEERRKVLRNKERRQRDKQERERVNTNTHTHRLLVRN
uniref:Coiled-coil domain containing 146 n=1 Tax=Myripristis murdjan TaxID=586833 RepID=A0A667Y3J7_9TELE